MVLFSLFLQHWCTYLKLLYVSWILPKLALSLRFSSVITSTLWHTEESSLYQDTQAHFICFLKHWYHAKIERFLSTPKGPLFQNLPNTDGHSSTMDPLYKSMLGDSKINHVVNHQCWLQCVLFLALYWALETVSSGEWGHAFRSRTRT